MTYGKSAGSDIGLRLVAGIARGVGRQPISHAVIARYVDEFAGIRGGWNTQFVGQYKRDKGISALGHTSGDLRPFPSTLTQDARSGYVFGPISTHDL